MWVRNDEIWFDDDWVDSGRRIFAMSCLCCHCGEQIIRTLFNVNTAFGQMAWFSDRHSAFSLPAIDRSLPLFICKIITRQMANWGLLVRECHLFSYLFDYYVVYNELTHYGNKTVDFVKEAAIKRYNRQALFTVPRNRCFIMHAISLFMTLVFEFN